MERIEVCQQCKQPFSIVEVGGAGGSGHEIENRLIAPTAKPLGDTKRVRVSLLLR
jgi:hypothetical protein